MRTLPLAVMVPLDVIARPAGPKQSSSGVGLHQAPGLLRRFAPRNDGVTGHINSSYRSRQVGFIDSISASFFFLDSPLICFSRAIASAMVECSSYQTSILHP